MEANQIKFHVSGKEHTVQISDVSPDTTLNAYLRKNNYLVGTKRMCLEGGCGCCLVAVEEKNPVNTKNTIFAVNSCLVSIFSCHGWKIHTIEGIGNPVQGYHEIQKLLSDNNGTQCGYCSPGMVMNMYALHQSGTLTEKQIENSFGSNICRCTGYRPILTAFKKLASDREDNSVKDIEDSLPCDISTCVEECKEGCQKKKLTVNFESTDSKWVKVYNVEDLLQILRTSTAAKYMLVAGNTARGVYKAQYNIDLYIEITAVAELSTSRFQGDTLILGGNMTLTNTMALFYQTSKQNPRFSYLRNMADHIDLVAHIPVRNIGTLAGNLMMKYEHPEFPSDIFLILQTVKAIIVIVDVDENESRLEAVDFLQLDMKNRVIRSIILQGYDSSYKYGSYKIMPRAQNAHAMVNAGFLFKMNGENVDLSRIVYGGINPQFVHAKSTEKAINKKNLFKNSTLKSAFTTLQNELKPNHVLPDPSPEFRKQLAISLLYKFILSITPSTKISGRNKSGSTLIDRPVSTGTQEFGSVTSIYPITKPIIKLEALAQTSGLAQYTDDLPEYPNQLYGSLVTAQALATSKITNIDTSEALKLAGVVAFFDKDNIPGDNTFVPTNFRHPLFTTTEPLFCEGTVKYYHQPVGILVATSENVALQGAQLVKISYSAPTNKTYMSIRDVLKDNVKDRIKHQTTVVPKTKGKDVKKVIKGEFHTSWQYHYHMELQCCNVVPNDDGGLDIYPSTQWLDIIQLAVAGVLKIPVTKVNVTVKRCGGAFGAKISRSSILACACSLAAYKLQKPVRMWMPLEQNMEVIGKRYPCLIKYEVGVNNSGVIQYMDSDIYSNFGVGGNEIVDMLIVPNFPSMYNSDTWDYSSYVVNTDVTAGIWCRAPGTYEIFAGIESIMEHIAYTMNIDPIQVKLANAGKDDDKPKGFINDFKNWAKIDERKQDIENFNKTNRWKKRGISVVPMVFTIDLLGVFPSLVSIFHGDGSVAVSHCGIEIGQGINTKVAQVVAYKFGIPLEKVSVKAPSTFNSPNGAITGGSMTSEAVCYAAGDACDNLLKIMKPTRDKMNNPTWEELVNKCVADSINLQATGSYNPNNNNLNLKSYKIYGVGATEVEVDILTGQHQIQRVDILEDVGDSMSPLVDVGQIEGAFVMGMGGHTTEEIVYDDKGVLYTNNTWTYKPPGAKDIPIEFHVKIPENNPNPVGVYHSKAVGEPPLCLSASVPLAIRNAVASARMDSDSTQEKWYSIDGPSTVENTFMNCLNNIDQYVL